MSFVDIAKGLMQALLSSGRRVQQAFMTSLLTVMMLCLFYYGFHVIRQGGSPVEGFKSAFLDTTLAQEKRSQDMRNAVMQFELKQVAASDRLITSLLQKSLEKSGTGARVRLSVIHNGVTGVTGIGLMRFDVTHAVAAPGRSTGELLVNMPLSDWNDYLSDMLSGRCNTLVVDRMANPAARSRLLGMNMKAFIVCPVRDVQGRMLGGVFLSWDANDPLPSPSEMSALADSVLITGGQIAAALDLRVPTVPYGKGH